MLNFNHKHKGCSSDDMEKIALHPQAVTLIFMGVVAIISFGVILYGGIKHLLNERDLPSLPIAAITTDVNENKQIIDCESFNYNKDNPSIVCLTTTDGYKLYVSSDAVNIFVGDGAHQKAEEYVQSININRDQIVYNENLQEINMDGEEITYFNDDQGSNRSL